MYTVHKGLVFSFVELVIFSSELYIKIIRDIEIRFNFFIESENCVDSLIQGRVVVWLPMGIDEMRWRDRLESVKKEDGSGCVKYDWTLRVCMKSRMYVVSETQTKFEVHGRYEALIIRVSFPLSVPSTHHDCDEIDGSALFQLRQEVVRTTN